MIPNVLILALIDILFRLGTISRDTDPERVFRDDQVFVVNNILESSLAIIDDYILETRVDSLQDINHLFPSQRCKSSSYNEPRYYCLLRDNIPEYIRTTKNDTCNNILYGEKREEWDKMDNITRVMIKKCAIIQLKTLIFNQNNGVSLPIDFVSNKFRKFTLIEKFVNNMYRIIRD